MPRKNRDSAKDLEQASGEGLPEATPAKRRRRRPAFYADSLDATGLAGEIALLRVRLRRALEEEPEDDEFVLKSIALLAKLLATRYRLSKKAEDDLYQSMLGVLKGLGGAIWPQAFGGEGIP